MPTGLMRNASWFTRKVIMGVVVPAGARILSHTHANHWVRTTSQSAKAVMRACFDTASLGERPQALYLDGIEEIQASDEARDEAKQKMLWRDSVSLAGLADGDTVLQVWK